MLTAETIKEKANLFRAKLRKLDKTSEDMETNIAIAKQEVSKATERVITKTRQQEKQLLGPIYTVRLCRMRQAYDRLTTRIVSCKSNLQLAYDS